MDRAGVPKLWGKQFLHPQWVPLSEVTLKAEHYDYSLFQHECEGIKMGSVNCHSVLLAALRNGF